MLTDPICSEWGKREMTKADQKNCSKFASANRQPHNWKMYLLRYEQTFFEVFE